MDSLYIRLKFGMPMNEFNRLVLQYPNLVRLQGSLQVNSQFIEFGSVLGAVNPSRSEPKYVLKQPLRFLDWAKTSELYDEAQLENLEWLICQELMKEMV